MTEEGDGQIDGLRMGREISQGEVKSFASKFKATTAKSQFLIDYKHWNIHSAMNGKIGKTNWKSLNSTSVLCGQPTLMGETA